ncbi:MAG: hypothetical protein QUS35_03050 [bacterium]|nr:hypothetical protein [bacterium]
MSGSSSKSFLKVLIALALAVTAILVGRKVVKNSRRRRTQEEY